MTSAPNLVKVTGRIKNVNQIIIMGRLTADVEMRQTQAGDAVGSFSVAVDGPKSRNGEKHTDFFRVTAWRKTAEFISSWFHKGDMIALSGSMHCREYTDNSGNRRTTWEMTAGRAFFCGGKNDAGSTKRPTADEFAQTAATDDFAVIDDNEDLPF